MNTRVSKSTKQAILVASLAVASFSSATPAQAQYMVIEGSSSTAKSDSPVVCLQGMYVQDYNSVSAVNTSTETEYGMSSTAVINGLFDGYIGVFGAVIGIPAILIAALRLFVRGQSDRKAKRKSFDLPAAPAPTRYYRPSPAVRY